MSFKSKLEKLLSSCVSVKAIGSPYYPLVKEGYLDFELFMNKGFKHHGLDLKRLSYLEKIHLQAFTDFDNIQPLSILQKNVQDLFPHLPSQGGRGKHISSAGHTILLSNHTDLMLHKNLHIGSGRTQHEYITFLRYGANVHLAAGAFSDIDSLISVMLPPGIKLDGKLELLFEVEDILAKGEVPTIPDLSIYMNVNWYYEMPESAGEKVTRFLFPSGKVPNTPITFDSKFVESASSLSDSELIRQQMTQFIHNRDYLFIESLDNLRSLPDKNRIELVSMFIPQFMQHYILVPANFPVGAANFSLFAKNAKEVARSVFGITLQSNSMPEGSEAYATFFKQMDKHIDAHFGGGKFIFNSQMEHPNLP